MKLAHFPFLSQQLGYETGALCLCNWITLDLDQPLGYETGSLWLLDQQLGYETGSLWRVDQQLD